MPSILAIVSKKVFDRDFRAEPGTVVPTTKYASTHPALAKLADGGDLFLVTVAPGDQLWLAGILAKPRLVKDGWQSAPSTTPITDITPLIDKLTFENGKGLTAKPGALAMSLQTPRTLTDDDAALLRAAARKGPISAAKPDTNANAKKGPGPITAGASHLERAQACLTAGALADALDELLAAWGAHKAAEIADLVDDLGAHIARALPAIEGTKTTLDGAWRDVGDQLRPADVPRLVAAFELCSSKQLEGWLEVLDRFVDDPRICAAAIDASVKFVASTAGRTRTKANRIAEKIADGRCIPQIEKLIAKRSDAWNATELRDRLKQLKTKFTTPPALAAGDKAVVKAIGAAIAKLAKGPPPDAASLGRREKGPATGSSVRTTGAEREDGARLLAEVLADPENDAPRVVYADWLSEHGDPRGEFITLQLLPQRTPEQEDRVKQLVKEYGAKWLGPLAAVVKLPVFRRGFLSECFVELKSPKHRDELLLHPLWATVESVFCRERIVVESPAMKGLRTIEGLSIEDYEALAASKRPLAIEAIEGIEIEYRELGTAGAALMNVGAFAKLRALGVAVKWSDGGERCSVARDAFAHLLERPLVRQLARLHLDLSRAPDQARVVDWLGMFDTHGKLATLELVHDSEAHVIVRRDGRQFGIELVLRHVLDETNELRWMVTEVPAGAFAKFPLAKAPALVVSTTAPLKKKQRAALESQVRALFAKQFETISFAAP